MDNILIAFITGITTGGLNCLAVQGGLLASSLSDQIEKAVQKTGQRSHRGSKKSSTAQPKLALPIMVFLTTKLVAYTMLGFLLGLAGQVFQLSIMARAILQIGIGIFMLGNALRMLNVHPIFRFFVIEPPAFLRRKIRNAAKNSDRSTLFAPAWLGFLTVLIPCGVTQAMMAVALGTGSPVQGALLMFAFTLGTSPVFFTVAYFATKLGERLEKNFVRITAIIILVLSIFTINTGLNLAGSPIALPNIFPGIKSAEASSAGGSSLFGVNQSSSSSSQTNNLNDTAGDNAITDANTITVNVENYGYSPDVIHAKADSPIQLRLVTNNVRSCSRAFVIPALRFQQILESTGTANINIPAQPKGTKMRFSCSMGMYTGMIIFDL